MTNGGIRLKNISNVIIRNMKMHNPPKGEDLVSSTGSTRVWVDHCDFSTDGLTGDKDYYDGLLDITHASDFVTVSWSKFHDHVSSVPASYTVTVLRHLLRHLHSHLAQPTPSLTN